MPKRKNDSGNEPVALPAAELLADEAEDEAEDEDADELLDSGTELELGDEFDEDASIDLTAGYGQGNGTEPTIRRAIEELREARRLRDDLDYLDLDD